MLIAVARAEDKMNRSFGTNLTNEHSEGNDNIRLT
jgi:hypothetical protein